MLPALTPILSIFTLVLIGVLCRRLHWIDDTGQKQISHLVFGLVLPCMLFNAAVGADFSSFGLQAGLCFLAGMFVPLPAFAIGEIVARIGRAETNQRQVIRVSAALSNTAFFGIPVCAALWGGRGALLASFYDMGITIPMFILGPLGYAVRPSPRSLKEAFINPIILAMGLGILCNQLGFRLPDAVMNPIQWIGQMTTPLALILVGVLLRFENAPGRIRPLALLVGSRMVLVPLAILGLACWIGIDKPVLQVVVLQSAMPTSVLGTLMADQYHSDAGLAVQGNLLTVVASLITLTLFVSLVQ
jgi:predicted permease